MTNHQLIAGLQLILEKRHLSYTESVVLKETIKRMKRWAIH